MGRQSKEDSLALWEFQKYNYAHLDFDISEELKKFMEVVDKKINDYSLTYDELIDDIIEDVTKLRSIDNIEDRRSQIKVLYNNLINKYTEDGE